MRYSRRRGQWQRSWGDDTTRYYSKHEFYGSLTLQGFFNGAVQPQTADGSPISMDALTLGMTKLHCKFLNRRQRFLSKPDFVIRASAICHGPSQYRVDAIRSEIPISLGILP